MQSTSGFNGEVAQLGERRPCTAKVAGSIPVFSTGDRYLVNTGMFFENRNRVKRNGIFVALKILVKLLRVNGGCLGADRR